MRRTSTRWLEDVIDAPVLASAIEEPDPDPDSWRRIRVTLDWPREVAGRLLALGGAIEVLEPPELRAEIASLAAETVARYREPASAGSAGHGRLRPAERRFGERSSSWRGCRRPDGTPPTRGRRLRNSRSRSAWMASAMKRHVEHGTPRPIDLSDASNPIVRWCQFLS